MQLIKEYNTSSKLFEYYFISDSIKTNRRFWGSAFSFAKPFNDGCAFVRNNDGFRVILEDGTDYFDDDDRIKKILDCLTPLNGIYTKYYRTGNYFLLSVDISKVKEINKNEIIKRADDLIGEEHRSYGDLWGIIAEENITANTGIIFLDENFSPSVCDKIFEDAGLLAEGLIPVKEFDKPWGFIDPGEGFQLEETIINYAIEPSFEFASPFKEGLAKVKLNNKYGFINKKGEWIVKSVYDDAKSFNNGYAAVALQKKGNKVGLPAVENSQKEYINRHSFRWGLINKNGEFVFNEESLSIHFFDKDTILHTNRRYWFDTETEKNKSILFLIISNLNKEIVSTLSYKEIREFIKDQFPVSASNFYIPDKLRDKANSINRMLALLNGSSANARLKCQQYLLRYLDEKDVQSFDFDENDVKNTARLLENSFIKLLKENSSNDLNFPINSIDIDFDTSYTEEVELEHIAYYDRECDYQDDMEDAGRSEMMFKQYEKDCNDSLFDGDESNYWNID